MQKQMKETIKQGKGINDECYMIFFNKVFIDYISVRWHRE